MSTTTVAIRVLSFAGNMRGSSERTWISSSSTAVKVRVIAAAASLRAGIVTRLAQASAWARASRSLSTESCTRPRRSWACFAHVYCSRSSASVA